MKRLLVIGMVMMIGVCFCSGNGFSATYDATGTWDYSTSGNWVNPGNAGCTVDPDETGVAYVTQNGNSITIVARGITLTGAVSGATWSVSGSFAEDGGITTVNINCSVSSSISSSATVTWSWSDGYYYCNGGGNIFMTKRLDGSGGNLVTSDLWIKAVINTEEKGPIEAVWQKGGEDTTPRGDRVIWGHFYASPSDVTWGSENNPDLFVKIWFDVSGRVDVNYFHVSVPEIEVYSDYPYDGTPDEHGIATMDRRYIRQYYENGQSNSDENYEDGNPPAGYLPAGNPSGYFTINDLRIGSIINTVEKGPIDALWRSGGQDTTSRGDQVLWGHFYASSSDVTWGSQNNPDLFVKIWFDVSGRTDVNFFHVSVPDIEVYSDLPDEGTYDQQGTTIMDNRYIRHEYSSSVGVTGKWNGTWGSSIYGLGGTFTANIIQQSSTLSGSIDIPGIGMFDAGLKGTVDGNTITFGDIEDQITFTGMVSGNSSSGTYVYPFLSDNGTWQATKE